MDKITVLLAHREHDGELDRGDAVQTVLIVAGLAMVVVLILAWVGRATKQKAAQAAGCIEAAGGKVVVMQNDANSRLVCKGSMNTQWHWYDYNYYGLNKDQGWKDNGYDNGYDEGFDGGSIPGW